MEVEMSPYLGGEILNAGIECRCRCNNDCQQRGIERIYVAKMNEVGIFAHQLADNISGENQCDNNQRD